MANWFGWLLGGLGVALLLTVGVAYAVALKFRQRLGFPKPRPPEKTPANVGLPGEVVEFPTVDRMLPGWLIPARDGTAGPGVVVVHGWEGNHARMLPVARFLHDAGFHVLLFDARGHGLNPPERYLTGAEFVMDTLAAIDYMAGRPEVTRLGLFGHSAGGTACILAASWDRRVGALASSSAFAGPVELTQRMLELAGLPSWRLFAEFVARVYVQPRGHRVQDYHAWQRIADVRCPILLIHGAADEYIPSDHLALLARRADPARTERWLVPGRGHRDLFNTPGYAERVVEFLRRSLGVLEGAA